MAKKRFDQADQFFPQEGGKGGSVDNVKYLHTFETDNDVLTKTILDPELSVLAAIGLFLGEQTNDDSFKKLVKNIAISTVARDGRGREQDVEIMTTGSDNLKDLFGEGGG